MPTENEKGYSARDLKILIDDGAGPVLVAAVNSKTLARSREKIDVTNDDSDGWARALGKPGTRSISLSIEGVATLDNYERFLVKWNGSVLEDVTIVHPNGATEVGAFFLTNLQHSGSSEAHVAFTAELESADIITRTAPAAPTNLVLPAISGEAVEDDVLTAFPGVWTGAPTFTYQWKSDGSNVAGATGQTYTVLTADIGNAITVVVTATNPAGSTPATSAPTADVVGA